MQTLSEIGINQNSTIVFPIDLVKPLLGALGPSEQETQKTPAELPQGNGVAAPLAPSKAQEAVDER